MQKLFKRYEFKYPIPDSMAAGMHDLLLRYGMQPDPAVIHKEHPSYTVTSLYFDTPTLNDYKDKAGGFLDRKKIRARIYEQHLTSDTKEIWLEKKAKHDMRISKHRILLTWDAYQELLAGSRTHLLHRYNRNSYAMEIISHIVRERMKPRLIVRYKRIPLVMPGPANFRITLDSNIETCSSNDLCYTPSMQLLRPGTTVMEVKFETILPSWLKTILQRYNLERASFSKYANSVEMLQTHNPIPR